MSRGPEYAVVSSMPVTAFFAGIPDTAVSLAIGLLGVILARTVFVDRENRRSHRHQTMRETVPLTLVAMLIAGVVIVHYDFDISRAAFAGLGVGWTAVLLLDVIGEWVLGVISPQRRVKIINMRDLRDAPGDMGRSLDLVDQTDKAWKERDDGKK